MSDPKEAREEFEAWARDYEITTKFLRETREDTLWACWQAASAAKVTEVERLKSAWTELHLEKREDAILVAQLRDRIAELESARADTIERVARRIAEEQKRFHEESDPLPVMEIMQILADELGGKE